MQANRTDAPGSASTEEIVAAANDEAFEAWNEHGQAVHRAIEREDLSGAADAASNLAAALTGLVTLREPGAAPGSPLARDVELMVKRYRGRREDERLHDASGNRIAFLRVAGGATVVQVAERIGVSEETLRGYEHGQVEVPDAHKLALAELFGVSVPWMLRCEGDPGDGDGDGGVRAAA